MERSPTVSLRDRRSRSRQSVCSDAGSFIVIRSARSIQSLPGLSGRHSRWRLCHLTDAAYPLRVQSLRFDEVCSSANGTRAMPVTDRLPRVLTHPRNGRKDRYLVSRCGSRVSGGLMALCGAMTEEKEPLKHDNVRHMTAEISLLHKNRTCFLCNKERDFCDFWTSSERPKKLKKI